MHGDPPELAVFAFEVEEEDDDDDGACSAGHSITTLRLITLAKQARKGTSELLAGPAGAPTQQIWTS